LPERNAQLAEILDAIAGMDSFPGVGVTVAVLD